VIIKPIFKYNPFENTGDPSYRITLVWEIHNPKGESSLGIADLSIIFG
jgi:hypothetical protein